jgi:DNA-binding NarL/FixJ family response regulator
VQSLISSETEESNSRREFMKRKRILLADDHVAITEEICALLKEDYDVVATVENGRMLVEAAQRLQPDLIITDISMPVMTGFEAASKIRALGVSSKLIFLTVQASPAYLKKARNLGADGYVLKVYGTEQLRTAVSKVLAGETYFSPQLQQSERTSSSQS